MGWLNSGVGFIWKDFFSMSIVSGKGSGVPSGVPGYSGSFILLKNSYGRPILGGL